MILSNFLTSNKKGFFFSSLGGFLVLIALIANKDVELNLTNTLILCISFSIVFVMSFFKRFRFMIVFTLLFLIGLLIKFFA